MVKIPEKEEERKQNDERKHHNAPLMNQSIVVEEAEAGKMKSESSKSRFIGEIPVKQRTPGIQKAKSYNKLAELRFGHGRNLDDDDNEYEEEEEDEEEEDEVDDEEEEVEEEVKKTEIDENFRPSKFREYYRRKAIQIASEKKNTIFYDKEDELEKMRSKRRNLDGELTTPQAQIAGKSRIGSSTARKKKAIIDDKEWELKKMSSKRRNLDGESRTPSFGYSINGQKLPKHPQIDGISEIIRNCSDPFEKKLLKTDVERIILDRNDVNQGIIPYLTEDEKAKLTKGGIPVNTYDEFGYHYEMKFESYHNCYYKLCDGWKRLREKLYKSYKLSENEDCYVAFWMFKHKDTGGVCFAVTLQEVKVQD